MSRVAIYDTTLRDGSQGEGVSYTVRDKLEVTTKLAKAAAIHGPALRRIALASGVGSIRERRATLGDAVAGPV